MSEDQYSNTIATINNQISTRSSRVVIFQQLIQFLNDYSIVYIVLGDTRLLPDIETDLDLCVEDVSVFSSVLCKFCDKYRYELIRADYHATGIRFDIISHHAGLGPVIFPGPDVLLYPTWKIKGSIGLSFAELLSTRIQTKQGYFIPDPANAFLYYLVRQLDKGNLTTEHEKFLSYLWHQDPTGCQQSLESVFDEYSVCLIAKAFQQGDWTHVESSILHLYLLLKSKSKPSISRLMWNSKRYIHRTTRPTGLFIAVFGPDGSGKSTVIAKVLEFLSSEFRSTRCIHLRPRIGVPPSKSCEIVTNPHGAIPRSIFSSILKLFYFIADYAIGYLSIVRPTISCSGLIVFDRYFQDIIVDPRRYRFGAPIWLARLAAFFIPSPDLSILLDAPTDVLQSRKQEVPYNETDRQRTEYINLFTHLPSGIVIDASQDIESVVADVNNAIIEYLSRRTRKRLAKTLESVL